MVRTIPRLLAVLFALGLVAAACGDDEPTLGDATTTAPETELADQTASVGVTGESLPGMPQNVQIGDATNDPAVGVVAPEVVGTAFDGTEVSITADGRPKVVMFVAHWCPHCQREIPAVAAMIDEGRVPDGVEIIAVSTAVRDGEDRYPPQRWLEGEAWPGTTMRDSADNEAVFAFGAGGFPYTVYLDAEHRVVARSAGELPADRIEALWLAAAGS